MERTKIDTCTKTSALHIFDQDDCGKFKNYSDTPINDKLVDDFQPRAQLKKCFYKGNIRSDDVESIRQFSVKYASDMNLVREELQHLELIQFRKQCREMKKDQEKVKEKTYADFEREKLYHERKLRVC